MTQSVLAAWHDAANSLTAARHVDDARKARADAIAGRRHTSRTRALTHSVVAAWHHLVGRCRLTL